jgi:signal transduction histidine kinase
VAGPAGAREGQGRRRGSDARQVAVPGQRQPRDPHSPQRDRRHFSELLQKTPLSESQREYVGTLHTASETLLALVNETLDFSKIEAGKLELETTEIDLQKCLDQALDLVASKAKGKGLELRCALGRGVPRRIVSDPTRLRQILVNLLDNGVKFTARGHVAVSVDWQADGDATGVLIRNAKRQAPWAAPFLY